MFRTLLWLFLIACSGPFAIGFSFTTTNPFQCKSMTISWTGGKAPFELEILPAYGVQRKLSIPSSAVQGGKGSYDWTVNLSAGSNFLLSISDATGFGTGGISDMLTVGNAVDTSNCDTTGPAIDFYFQQDATIQQCADYSFFGYDNATQPVTIYGLIPDGNPITYKVPNGVSNFTTKANIPAGSSVIFCMYDSKGRNGGCSGILVARSSDDKSCLSPTSTTTSTSGTSATGTSPTPANTNSSGGDNNNNNNNKTKSGLSGGVYVGIGVGAVVGLGVLAALVFLCMRRKRENVPYRSSTHKEETLDLNYEAVPLEQTNDHIPYDPYNPNNRVSQFVTPLPPRQAGTNVETTPSAESSTLEGPSSSGRGSRIVVHNDITDDGVIELPPQYSAGREPIPGMDNTPSRLNPKQPRLVTLTPTDAT